MAIYNLNAQHPIQITIFLGILLTEEDFLWFQNNSCFSRPNAVASQVGSRWDVMTGYRVKLLSLWYGVGAGKYCESIGRHPAI